MSKLQACVMPWMRLVEQNFQEIITHIQSKSSTIPYMFYNFSGEIELNFNLSKFINQDQIQKFNLDEIRELIENNKDVIVISTYDSFDRLLFYKDGDKVVANGLNYDALHCDEAHHLEERYKNVVNDAEKAIAIIDKINDNKNRFKKIICWTATPPSTILKDYPLINSLSKKYDLRFFVENLILTKIQLYKDSETKNSLSNRDIDNLSNLPNDEFDIEENDCIFENNEINLIEKDPDGMGGRLADYITKTFEFQHDKICEYSKGRLAAKVNVALPNTASILAVLNRSNFRAWIKENPDINVCVYTTKTGLCGIGPQVHLMGIPILPSFLKIDPKSDFYSVNDKLFGVFSDKMCTPECHNSKLLIFSCLKLKEGISIPSLTGYIHLNQNLTSEFLVQAITRAARLLGVDRKTRDQKVGNLDEISNYNELFAEYIKQYCLVNVPDGRLFEEVYRMFKEHIWNNELFGRFSGSTQRPVGPWPPDPRPFPTSPEVPTTEKEYYHKLIVDMCEGLSELEILLLETLGLIDTGYQKVFESIKKECVLDPWPETQIDWIKIEKIMKDQPILDYVMKNKRKYAPKGAFPAEAIKRYGTIYTPEFVVEKTVDLAWKYLPKDVDPLSLTWCDPAAGDGNFLVYVYDRLMKCPSSMNPVEKSTHILTKCLFGIEILKPMVVACKVRLLERHIKTVKESGIPGELNVWDKLNITHGNTIMVPEDVGKWELSEYEGGLLPEEIRNKRYSVVCGNPPYTHLRNLANRRYSAYPKQRDMAQVFVRWALDHITEKGVVSYNTTDAWLNVKLSDGAKETRQLINKRIREIIREQDVVNYSMGDGGDIRTFIICLGTTENELFVLNGRETQKDIMEPAFCDLQVKSILNFHYALFNRTFPRCEGNKVRTNSDKMRNIYFNDNGQTWFLFCKYQPKNILPGLWKLVNTDEFISFSKRNLESRIRRCEMNKESALFLVGYLNTTSGIIETSRISVSANMDVRQLSTDGLKSIRIPDFDYYKSTYPERFAAYMKWVEDNMRNKDAFLSGIDAAFKKLIGEEND